MLRIQEIFRRWECQSFKRVIHFLFQYILIYGVELLFLVGQRDITTQAGAPVTRVQALPSLPVRGVVVLLLRLRPCKGALVLLREPELLRLRHQQQQQERRRPRQAQHLNDVKHNSTLLVLSSQEHLPRG